MNYVFSVVLNVFLILVENCTFLFIASSFFKIKRQKAVVIAAFCFLFLVSNLAVALFGTSVLKSVALVVIYSLFLLLCYYSSSIVKCVFVAAFWLAYLAICDAALTYSITFIFRIALEELMQSPESYYFMCFSIKTAELFVVIIFHTWMKERLSTTSINNYDWLRSIFIPLSCLLLSILLFRLYYLDPSFVGELLLCSIILLLVDFSSVFLLDYLDRQSKAIYDNTILRQNMKAQIDSIAAWKAAYSELKKQSHDIDNHMVTIQGLIKTNVPKCSILSYIDSIQARSIPELFNVKTNRIAADIILSQKKAIAKSKNIVLNIYIDDLSLLPLSDDELVTVVSNLIDNAIEAVDTIEEASRRYINFKLRPEGDVYIIFCENPTDTVIEIQNGRIKTTKKKAIDHGYGIQNIVKVLEEHNDIYSFSFDKSKKLFSFSAQLN